MPLIFHLCGYGFNASSHVLLNDSKSGCAAGSSNGPGSQNHSYFPSQLLKSTSSISRTSAAVALLPAALLVVLGSDMSSLTEGLALSCINAGREALPSPCFLTLFRCVLALPPELAAVSLAQHL